MLTLRTSLSRCVSRWSARDLPDSLAPGAVYAAVEDGRYEIETQESGLLAVQFVGTYHEDYAIPLYADTAVRLEIDVRLGTTGYVEELERVMVGGNFNDYDPSTAIAMERQPDGRFTAEIETTDSVVKYLIEERRGSTLRTFPGTDSDEFTYGPQGYESVVRPVSGKVSIVLDPSKIPDTECAKQVTYREPDSFTERSATIHDEINRRVQIYRDAQPEDGDADFSYDWTEVVAEVEGQIESERNPVLRRLLLLSLFELVDYDAAVDRGLIARGLEEISATSPLWSLRARSMIVAVEYLARPVSTPADSFSPQRLLAAIDSAELADSIDAPAAHVLQALNDHPDPQLRVDLLDCLLWSAAEADDSAKQESYYQRLVMEYPESMALDYWRTVLSPDRNIAVGKMIPDFSVTSLEDSSAFYTRSDLLGSVYLLDFWATWCAPCVAEMPNVHEAYNRYKDQGFQVLSVAVGDNREDIADFRKDKWPMPRLHAYHSWNDEAVGEFEVAGIPRAILVDENGVILAADHETRAERLHEVLERVLGRER